MTLIDPEVIRAHAHGSVHISTAGATPVWHCDHDNGEMSIRASDVYGSLDVYIGGTREDIVLWAQRIRSVAIQGGE